MRPKLLDDDVLHAGRAAILHAAFIGLDHFVARYGRLPRPHNTVSAEGTLSPFCAGRSVLSHVASRAPQADAEEVLMEARAAVTSLDTVARPGELDEDLVRLLARTAVGRLSPMVAAQRCLGAGGQGRGGRGVAAARWGDLIVLTPQL